MAKRTLRDRGTTSMTRASGAWSRLLRVFRIDLDFRRPPSCDVLILFTDTARQLKEYFPNRRVRVVDIDSGHRYVRILLKCLIKRDLTMAGYLISLINQSGASLAISLQDNFLQLYAIQGQLTRAKVVLIQNGSRSMYRDLESELEMHSLTEPLIHSYLAYTDVAAERIRARVKCQTVVIGSFRSNHIPRSSRKPVGLAYISTYNPRVAVNSVVQSGPHAQSVTYGEILQIRLGILLHVQQYCSKVDLPLTIIGKRHGKEAEEERSFFESHLSCDGFIYRARQESDFQYRACDDAAVVVSTSSTLGYESLSRGNKTVFFLPDSRILSDESLAFGWPSKQSAEGPFWSTEASYTRVMQVLNQVHAMSDVEWEDCRNSYTSAFPLFDPGNRVLVEHLSGFGARTPQTVLTDSVRD